MLGVYAKTQTTSQIMAQTNKVLSQAWIYGLLNDVMNKLSKFQKIVLSILYP